MVGTLMSPTLDAADACGRRVVRRDDVAVDARAPAGRRGRGVDRRSAAGRGSSNRGGRLDNGSRLHAQITRWKTSKIDPIRQYVRLLESLVLFAENELVPDGGTRERPGSTPSTPTS